MLKFEMEAKREDRIGSIEAKMVPQSPADTRMSVKAAMMQMADSGRTC